MDRIGIGISHACYCSLLEDHRRSYDRAGDGNQSGQDALEWPVGTWGRTRVTWLKNELQSKRANANIPMMRLSSTQLLMLSNDHYPMDPRGTEKSESGKSSEKSPLSYSQSRFCGPI
ncbi:hypothetical protein KP509_13G092200 [Ceratopteris richardii]|uniref:Uncharacterized protein n=1 Tax=Ceratopteris richardii TaxID=49495 RepID=A0A8T2THM9_CERRI|nr:hypothetical protein KP509_13G092200 [Ceratopteris richardii]